MSETRNLAAILVSDVVGYSRLADTDGGGTLAPFRAFRSDLIDPAIADHYGRIVRRTGDGSIIEFRSVVDAVGCAIEARTACSSATMTNSARLRHLVLVFGASNYAVVELALSSPLPSR
jgi:class 3 adenylate cyclase